MKLNYNNLGTVNEKEYTRVVCVSRYDTLPNDLTFKDSHTILFNIVMQRKGFVKDKIVK